MIPGLDRDRKLGIMIPGRARDRKVGIVIPVLPCLTTDCVITLVQPPSGLVQRNGDPAHWRLGAPLRATRPGSCPPIRALSAYLKRTSVQSQLQLNRKVLVTALPHQHRGLSHGYRECGLRRSRRKWDRQAHLHQPWGQLQQNRL